MIARTIFFYHEPEEVATRSFKLYPTTDQASKYACSGKEFFLLIFSLCCTLVYILNFICFKFFLNAAILKDSEFNEADRAECQFTTTAAVLDNGTQVKMVVLLHLHFTDITDRLSAKSNRSNIMYCRESPFNHQSHRQQVSLKQSKTYGTSYGVVCQTSLQERIAGSFVSIV